MMSEDIADQDSIYFEPSISLKSNSKHRSHEGSGGDASGGKTSGGGV